MDAFHTAGLGAGGRDNGPPGLRPRYHQHYYGAFVLDPDGNNLEAVCHRPSSLQQERPIFTAWRRASGAGDVLRLVGFLRFPRFPGGF